jgi:hypothetical protein
LFNHEGHEEYENRQVGLFQFFALFAPFAVQASFYGIEIDRQGREERKGFLAG